MVKKSLRVTNLQILTPPFPSFKLHIRKKPDPLNRQKCAQEYRVSECFQLYVIKNNIETKRTFNNFSKKPIFYHLTRLVQINLQCRAHHMEEKQLSILTFFSAPFHTFFTNDKKERYFSLSSYLLNDE
jgi:hypothetical protein